jgi:hypothetical protein
MNGRAETVSPHPSLAPQGESEIENPHPQIDCAPGWKDADNGIDEVCTQCNVVLIVIVIVIDKKIKSNQMFGVIGWVRNTDTSTRRLAGGKIQLGGKRNRAE